MNPSRGKPTFDVYVGNLPSTADEDGMKRLFGSFGGIQSVLLKDGKQTGTKFGFVRFFEEESAVKAVSDASGKYVNGKVLVVKKAERNPTNKFSGGGSGGGGGISTGGGGDASTKQTGFKDNNKDGTSARTRGMRQETLTVIAEESVMLTHASNACSVYVQLSSQEAIEQSTKLMVEMQEYSQSAPKITSKPQSNVLYGAVFSEDGLWYRCKVLASGPTNSREVHVRYVDYGNEEVTDASKMVQLTGELATVKPQACKVHMHGLRPTCTAASNAEEHKRAVNFLMGVADNKFITARLYKPLVHGDESVPCELHCEGQDLNRLMRDHGFAVPITPVASPMRGPDQPQQNVQNGFGGAQQAAPKQQRQGGGGGGGHQQQNQQHQNRHDDGAGRKQGTGNRQQGQQHQRGGGSRQPRNDAQLEGANREIKGLKGNISKLDKQLLALKAENEGLQTLSSSAVQHKLSKLQRTFEKVKTLRKTMSLDVEAVGVIETAINFLENTETSISKKVLDAQEVMAANDRLEECQENLRKCTDKELLPDLMVARNEARQETFQAITGFLSKTKALPLLDRHDKVKIALECLEAEYFDLLATKDTSAAETEKGKLLEECIQEYTEWKTENCNYLSTIRSKTDQTLTLWTSLLAKLLLSFRFDTEENVEPVEETDELIDKLIVDIDTEIFMSEKAYQPVVKLDPTLVKTKEQRETIKTRVLTKTVCCLTKELRRELASIETLTELYNHHEELSRELEPWMNSKPDVSDMQAVQRDIKGLRSRLRHKLADKHDIDEAPELYEEKNRDSLQEELDKIRCDLQAAYATEDRLLVNIAALTKRHFPELSLQNPTFRIDDYLETNGLLKQGRDLQQFDLQPVPCTKSSAVKSGQFNGQKIIIKSYNVSSEDVRKTLLHNAIAYSKLDIDRLLHIQVIIPTSELAEQLHCQLPQLPRNLVRTVREVNPTPAQLQTIFIDIVTGLKALHSLDVIHGAVHPENILVTEDAHAVIAEYDFSKTPTERAQQGYKADNGLQFTAPEINCGLEAHVASDMFAFGVSLLWAHYPTSSFTTQPDGTPDIASITMEPELGDIIKQLINYSQGKRPHSDAVIASTYFTIDLKKREEEERQRREEEQRQKEEEERKKREEEERKKQEEERKKLEEERKKQEEDQKKLEEEQKKLDEEQKKQEEEEELKRQEEARKKEEERNKEDEERQKKNEEVKEAEQQEMEEKEVVVKEEPADDDDDEGPPALEPDDSTEETGDVNQNTDEEMTQEVNVKCEPAAEDEASVSKGVESSL